MKTLILVFVIIFNLGVAVTATRANIGDTEQRVLMTHLGDKVDRDTIDERAKVIVFTTSVNQYAVGILDGKVESEVFTSNNDSAPDKDLVLNTIHGYRDNWFAVPCPDDCAAVMSDDGKYFARIGASKELRKKYVFWVFTDTWRMFALSKKKGALPL